MFLKRKKEASEPKKTKTKKSKRSRVSKSILYGGWAVLIFSVGLGVYNNFTAVSTHTVHEKEIVKEQLTDTTGLQAYAKDFARLYFTISPTSKDQQIQKEALEKYLAENLSFSNSTYKELKEKVTVKDVEVWQIKAVKNHKNVYSVMLKLLLATGKHAYTRSYSINVYCKDNQFTVVKLPTLATLPNKASIEPEKTQTATTVEATTVVAVEGFLDTFFSVYPKAEEKELIYYGKNLQPVMNNLTFLELNNAQMNESKQQVEVNCVVTYRDNDTKLLLEMPYHLILEKVSDGKFAIKELQ